MLRGCPFASCLCGPPDGTGIASFPLATADAPLVIRLLWSPGILLRLLAPLRCWPVCWWWELLVLWYIFWSGGVFPC
jgi:hypothetical protein